MNKPLIIRVRHLEYGNVWAILPGKCGVLAKDKKTALEEIKAKYPAEYEVEDIPFEKPNRSNGK